MGISGSGPSLRLSPSRLGGTGREGEEVAGCSGDFVLAIPLWRDGVLASGGLGWGGPVDLFIMERDGADSRRLLHVKVLSQFQPISTRLN